MRRERNRIEFERCLKNVITKSTIYDNYNKAVEIIKVDQEKVVHDFHENLELDMDNHSYSEALDDLYAFYKMGPL